MPSAPSDWILRFAPLIPAGASLLDLASGSGRHTIFFLARGVHVTAVDIDVADLARWSEAHRTPGTLELIRADLEGGPWPLAGRTFDAVLVTNYLWLPIIGDITTAVAQGGLLVYETFGQGNEVYGRPSNPDYLLAPGVLLAAVAGNFQVVAYEHGLVEQPRPAVLSRICAVRTSAPVTVPLYREASR